METIKVLLIEDDEDDFVITRSLLDEIEGKRFQLDWAQDYDSAKDHLARGEYDICLLDYRLGAQTGLELLREVRAAGNQIPIIFLTGQTDRAIDLEAMQAGASDYLVKNQINAAALERSIRYALAQKRNAEERIKLVREQEARAAAEAANRAKDDFLAVVSHELRGPLNAIIGWITVLRSGKADEKIAAQALETIERNARAQVKIIEDLLDVSRIINGNLRLQLAPINLAPVVDAAIAAARPSADAKEIELIADVDPTTGRVMGDPDRLQQVVTNLLSNAIKFTPNGGRVETQLMRVGDQAQIKVSDTGVGISADFLPRIFDRYTQANGSTTKRKGGLGLGLAIVRHIVEMHNGQVIAQSAGEDKGATFTVRLPILQ
jgi:signal transduction histidine kinase